MKFLTLSHFFPFRFLHYFLPLLLALHSIPTSKSFDSNELEFNPINCELIDESTECLIKVTINSTFTILTPPENTTTVRKFTMINNKLTKFLPLQIGQNFADLNILNVSGNSLKILTKSELSRLFRLKVANFEKNEIEEVKFNAFDDLISLDVLDLDYNKIKFLDAKVFSSTYFLRHLSIHHNQLTTLHEDIFEYKINLESVKLQHNLISNLSHRMLDHVPHLKRILLQGNVCIDKNYEGKRIASSYAVDVSRMCENYGENDWNFLVFWGICSGVLMVLGVVAGISYKVYNDRKWAVRTVSMDAFENPRFKKDGEFFLKFFV